MILEREKSLHFISILFWLHTTKSASLPRRSNSPVTITVETFIRTEAQSARVGVPPEAYMSAPELVSRNGFPVETHKVNTSDGYILTVFRIPHGRNNETGKGPLILGHCFLCSSSDWLLLVPHYDDCLPYVLANEGYDVWMINFRGNEYSQEHVNLSIYTFEFWNFSVHEMGLYDTPATVEYVLSKTGSNKLGYIGHSMGTTAFFIAMDHHPDLQEKVEKMVALAPAAYVSHTKSPARYFAPASAWFFWISKTLNHGRMLSPLLVQILHSYVPKLCEYTPMVCSNAAFLVIGYDPKESTPETLAVLAGHTPAESSAKAMSHFLQWMVTPRFQEYDYGEMENLVHYNQTKPPLYKLQVNKVPTFVLYGLNDFVIAEEDLDRTVRELGNAVRVQAVPDPQWNHLDFLYGKDAKSLVYSPILNFLPLVIQETETT